jgi:hypothetical protein
VTFAALFIGGLAILLYFRDRGWHPAGALVAALSFAFGGSAASRLQHTGEVMSLALLPLVLWLLERALQRRSWRYGVAAGLAASLIVLRRDQVALLEVYLFVGFVVAYWFGSNEAAKRIRESLPPLAAGAVAGAVVIAIPITLTMLLAEISNRPEIDFVSAGRGSLHPAHLLTLVFADLFGAADPQVPYWGPPSFTWGPTDLFLAQNMGQLYLGALPIVALLWLGVIRGQLWVREIRFFSVAALLLLAYALGWYTPIFRIIYEVVPGIKLFRRPADAAFVFCGLFAFIAGYLVHRWLSGARLFAPRRHWTLSAALSFCVLAAAFGVTLRAHQVSVAVLPVVTGLVCVALAVVYLDVSARIAHSRPLITMAFAALLMTGDLAWNNWPNESTGLPPNRYEELRPDTNNETIAFLKERLAQSRAPDRRDRVELIGIGYSWPNLGLINDFDHVFGLNPLRLRDFAAATNVGDTVASPDQRTFSALFPSYRSRFADLLGERLIATGVPVEQIDKTLKPGDLLFLKQTADAYIYENPRALPRAMFVPRWQRADFSELIRAGWPDVDPRHVVLLEQPPSIDILPSTGAASATVRIVYYGNTEVTIEVDAPSTGFLVLNDAWHKWWRASVDETPAPILKANVLFRAVALAPGRHRVRFEFHPFAGAFAEVLEKIKGWRDRF